MTRLRRLLCFFGSHGNTGTIVGVTFDGNCLIQCPHCSRVYEHQTKWS